MTSFWSYSNSTQEPRYGMIFARKERCPSLVKKTPGDRWSWEGGIRFVNSESASQVDFQVESGEGQNLLTGIGHSAVNVIEIINVGVQSLRWGVVNISVSHIGKNLLGQDCQIRIHRRWIVF
jgi:hypothetical protein